MEKEPEHVNPFASPLAEETPAVLVPSDIAEIEAIRREHLSREASIKSMGLIAYFGAILTTTAVAGAAAGAFAAIQNGLGVAEFAIASTLSLLIVALMVVSWWVAAGLRRLNPAVRPWTIVLGVLWFLFTLRAVNVVLIGVSFYSIWLVSGEKARYIFSDEYKQIISLTPHIRYKTSIVVWILLGLVLLLVVLGFVAFLIEG